MTRSPPPRIIRRFLRDQGGSNAVEFAILALPAITLLLFALQIGLYAMTKAALDTGVLRSAEALEAQFNGTTVPTLWAGATLKANVATKAGGLVINNTQLAVEVQPLSNLSSSRTAISDQLTNYGAPHSALAVRASFVTPTFVPGLSAVMTAYSSALVRRQSL